mgnify:CR=1 FL=1
MQLCWAAARIPTLVALSSSSLAEGNLANATVGTLSTTDPDAADTFTYSLVTGTGSTDNASFSITGSTLSIIPVANYEAKSSYSIRVRATDGTGAYYEKTLTITVLNVNEAPSITSGTTATVAENAATSTVVYQTVATDPDAGTTLTYSLGGTDAAAFVVSASGAVTLKNPADFETKSSYSFSVTASDGTLSASKTVALSVTNVDRKSTRLNSSHT